MCTRHAVVLAGLLVVTPTPSVSQVIQGRVIDAATRAPVAAVTLHLLQGDQVVEQVVSDSAGRFLLRATSGGRYQIAAARLGYAETKTQTLELGASQTLAAELQLSVAAVRIAPLEVEAPRDPYLEGMGFYERMRLGSGYYLTETEIRKRAGSTLVDLLRTTRGVKIQRVNTRQEVYLTSPTCLPQIVLDGVMVRWGGRGANTLQPLEDLVRVPHIEAIEVYRAFNGVPGQYVGPNAHCGTILIWTRHR